MSLKKGQLQDMFMYLTRDMQDSVKKQILKVSGRGNVSASRDYIAANCLITEVLKANPNFDLSKVTDEKQLWDQLHPATKYRLRAYTPMLAIQYDALKEAEQKDLFNNHNWVFTEKQNGCRGWLIVHNGTMHIYSRNYSDKDCGLLEYADNIDQKPNWNGGVYAIDVEIKFEPGADIREQLAHLGLETDSPLEAMVALLHTYPEEAVKIQQKFKELYGKDLIVFRLIAPLYFNGVNYGKRTLGEGQDVYDECVQFGQHIGLNVKPIQRCNGNKEEKENFLNTIISLGGEGVVVHNRLSPYVTSENRSKTGFVKIKRSVSATLNGTGMGDSIDCFITGFKMGANGTANEGLISALEMSCYINDNGRIYKHQIASIPNIERETKIDMTWENADGAYPQEVQMSDGTMKWFSLNPEWDGLVGEVDGQEISNVSKRLTHPRLLRWRFERSPESCIYVKEFIDSQMARNLK